MEIVRASVQDIEVILSLNQLLNVEAKEFKGNAYDFVKQEVAKGNYFVVKDGGTVVAAACISPRDEGVYLETIAISEAYQKKGIGSELIEHAKKVTKDHGFDKLFVDTYCQYSADDFYTKCGFKKIPTMGKYKGKPYHKFLLELPSTTDAEYSTSHTGVIDLSHFG
jgi:N-acetylglutamate synthase-like GNAT family acetyltransferase